MLLRRGAGDNRRLARRYQDRARRGGGDPLVTLGAEPVVRIFAAIADLILASEVRR
jgi:hypothetical protein